MEVGVYIRPYPGEHVSGDGSWVFKTDSRCTVAIIDVLGHGPSAADLKPAITDYFDNNPVDSPARGLCGLDSDIKGSRGAAIGLAVIDVKQMRFVHAGVGNTVTRRIRLGHKDERFVSRDGVVGGNMRTPNEMERKVLPGDLFLFYTDGVREHFDSRDYATMMNHDAQTVARNVVHRFGKKHDDAGCIVVKVPR